LFNNYILSFAADESIINASQPEEPNPLFTGILGTSYKPLTKDEEFAMGLNVLFAGFKILT
jgi:hypothetical protein